MSNEYEVQYSYDERVPPEDRGTVTVASRSILDDECVRARAADILEDKIEDAYADYNVPDCFFVYYRGMVEKFKVEVEYEVTFSAVSSDEDVTKDEEAKDGN